MSKITLETIAQELTPLNWKILSTEYKTLNDEFIVECPNGHTVYSTWKKLRSNLDCPICAQAKNQFKLSEVKQKKSGQVRILALDQATNISGYSIYEDKTLLTFGDFTTQPGEEIDRICQVKNFMISLIQNFQIDAVALEGIQYQPNSGVTTFQTLAHLQGVLMATLFELKIPFKLCPTNTWRAHCGVKGQTRTEKKKSMQLIIKAVFGLDVNEDCADAIGIGKYMADTYTPKKKVVDWE